MENETMSTDTKIQVCPVSIVVDFPGRDRLTASFENGSWKITVIGCVELQKKVKALQIQQTDLTLWKLPTGASHEDLLLRELILRAQGQWNYPYEHLEICHCRSVPTDTVDQAVLAGAHDCKRVSQQTSASTACGTCRPEVQKIIDYRLGK